MLPEDIKVLDLGSDNWSRLASLAREVASRFVARPDTGPLLVIYRGLKTLKAVDLSTGTAVRVDFMGTSRLDALSRQTGFPLIVAIEENALARIFGHAQRELKHDDDLVNQCGAFLRGFAAEWRKTIFTHPRGPDRIVVPPYAVIDRATRLFIPDDSVVLLAVTERGRAWASLVVGYRGGEFWLLSSLDTLGREDADLADGALEDAAEGLRSMYGGTVRVVAIERGALFRALDSRFPVGALLWAMNTSELRMLNVPLRWKAAALIGVRRLNCEFIGLDRSAGRIRNSSV